MVPLRGRSRQKPRIRSRIVRGLRWGLLGIGTLILAAVAGVAVLGYTDRGHALLLGAARPFSEKALLGRLHIGGLDGGLLSHLVLRDVVVEDPEGQVAVAARRIEVQYRLAPLLRGRVEVALLQGEGLVVRARYLRDGRLNLLALMRPSPAGGTPGTARVRIEQVRIDDDDGAVSFAPQQASRQLDLRFGLHGGASIDGDHVSLDSLSASVEAEGASIEGILPAGALPGGRLLGRWQVSLTATGPLSALEVGAVLHPAQAGAVAVQGTIDADTLAWRGTVGVRDLDPGAAWSGAPHGRIALDAGLSGRGPDGTAELGHLEVDVAGAHLQAQGHAALDLAGLEARALVETPDLRALGALRLWGTSPLPPLAGALTARARVALSGGRLEGDATVEGSHLVLPGARVARLAMAARAQGLDDLAVTLSAQGLAAGRGVQLRDLSLKLHGVPRLRAGRPRGFDGTLDALTLSLRGQTVRLDAPASLQVGPEVAVTGLSLGLDDQRLSLDGRYDPVRRTVSARLRAAGIDVQKLLALAGPPESGPLLPRSRLAAQVLVSGSVTAPTVEVAVDGSSEPLPPFAPDALTHHLQAHYRAGRITGELTLGSAGGAGPRLEGHVDLPLPLAEAPLFASLHLDVPAVQRFAAVLPKELSSLRGAFSADVRIGGSPQRPQVLLDLAAPEWGLLGLQHNAAMAHLDLRDGRVATRSRLVLARGPGAEVGSLSLEMDAPLALDLLHPPAGLAQKLLRETPLDLRMDLAGLNLALIPWADLGLVQPPGAATGIIKGSARLSGTGSDPALALSVAAQGVALMPVRRPLNTTLRADWHGDRVRLDVDAADASPGGGALLTLHGSTGLSLLGVLAGKTWRDARVDLTVSVPGLDLALLPNLAGSARGRIALSGTVGSPEAEAEVQLQRLRVSDLDLGDLNLTAAGGIDAEHAKARLGLRQGRGGGLDLDALIPRAADRPWRVSLAARRLDLGSLAAAVPSVRRVDARLDAGVTLGGSRADPRLDGFLRMQDGTVEMDDQPAPYSNIHLDVVAKDGLVDLKRLGLRFQKGVLDAAGRLRLTGLRPVGFDGTLRAERFPVAQGDLVGHLDAQVRVQGEARDSALHGDITVERGTLRLPKLEGRDQEQSVTALADVEYVDRAAARAAQEEAARAADTSSTPLFLRARVPGPFYVSGPDVSADLLGDVQLVLSGGRARIVGRMEVARGTVQISERPYTVEKALASFDGTDDPDPTLDVRLTRDVRGARLIIEVTGTARAPRLDLHCEPPIYDRTKLITMVATGDDGTRSDDKDRPLDQQVQQAVVGAVAGLLVSKLKNEFGSYLPIEVLKLDLGYQGLDAVPHARLEVGKYLLSNLYLSYVYQNAPQSSQRRLNNHEAHLEYSFWRNLSMMATFGDAAVGALDLYWNHRF